MLKLIHYICIAFQRVGINVQRDIKLCNERYNCENTTAFSSSWDWHCNLVAIEMREKYLVEKSISLIIVNRFSILLNIFIIFWPQYSLQKCEASSKQTLCEGNFFFVINMLFGSLTKKMNERVAIKRVYHQRMKEMS